MKEINLKTNLTEEDVILFQKDNLLKTNPLISNKYFLGVFLVNTIFVVLLDISEGVRFDSSMIGVIVGLLIVMLCMPFLLKYRAKKMYRTNRVLKNPIHYIINEDGVRIENVVSTSNLKWDKLYDVYEGKYNFLLYFSKYQAFIIPKRCFEERKDDFKLMKELIQYAPDPDINKVIFVKGILKKLLLVSLTISAILLIAVYFI